MKPSVTLLLLWLSAIGPAPGRGASVCKSSPSPGQDQGQGHDGANRNHELMRPGCCREGSGSLAGGRDRDGISDLSPLGRSPGGHEPGRLPNELDGVALGTTFGHPSSSTSTSTSPM